MGRSVRTSIPSSEGHVVPTPGALKIFLPVVSILPLLLFVLLSAPAWICWPFSRKRRQGVVIVIEVRRR